MDMDVLVSSRVVFVCTAVAFLSTDEAQRTAVDARRGYNKFFVSFMCGGVAYRQPEPTITYMRHTYLCNYQLTRLAAKDNQLKGGVSKGKDYCCLPLPID